MRSDILHPTAAEKHVKTAGFAINIWDEITIGNLYFLKLYEVN